MDRIEIEKTIVRELVTRALNEGWTVSVGDSEEWPVMRSTNPEEIIEATRSTDQDCLLFHRAADKTCIGYVDLVYGNGIDVISDHSCGGPLDRFMEDDFEWVGTLEEQES